MIHAHRRSRVGSMRSGRGCETGPDDDPLASLSSASCIRKRTVSAASGHPEIGATGTCTRRFFATLGITLRDAASFVPENAMFRIAVPRGQRRRGRDRASTTRRAAGSSRRGLPAVDHCRVRSGRLGIPHEFLLIEPFRRAGIASWVTRNGPNHLLSRGSGRCGTRQKPGLKSNY